MKNTQIIQKKLESERDPRVGEKNRKIVRE